MNAEARRVRLGDVVRQVTVSTRDPSALGLIRVVGLEHLDSESLRVERWISLDDLPEGTSFTRIFRAGQVLFGKRRAYQRKVGVPQFDGLCSSDILVFESASEDLLPEFLPLLIQSDDFFAHALDTSAGSLSPRTKWPELAKYEFSLPTTAEQEAAVELLQAVDAVLDASVRVRTAADVTLAALLRALLDECSVAPLVPCELAADVQVGKKLSPDKRLGVRPRPTLRAVNLRLDGLDLGGVNEMDFTEDEDDALSVREGDILLVEGGNRDSVGAPTWIAETPEPSLYIQNTIVRLRPRAGGPLLPRFLYWAWRAMYVAGHFERVAVGTKLYHFGPKRVSQYEIPVPDADVQKLWMTRLDAVQALRDALARQHSDAEAMRSHLLNEALEDRTSVQ